MKDKFVNLLEDVEDSRSKRNQKHPFITIIGTTFFAVFAGIDSFTGIEDFVRARFNELKDYFDFPKGVPSHDTYRRIWDALDSLKFQKTFLDFVKMVQESATGAINIDGKTIRNSGESGPFHVVTAWCNENELVLGQEKTSEKSNEITAIPKLLELLDIRNRIITIDAMGAQREICQDIIEGKGEYVIALKGNQGNLFKDVQECFEDPKNEKLVNVHNDKGHGRIEQRVATVINNIQKLNGIHGWPGLKSIAKVESTVTKKGKETKQTRYYICSKKFTDAGQLNHLVRGHWSIENKLHWVLDVVYNEDRACIRRENAALNMNILRKWALSVLIKVKSKPSQSIKSVMRFNCMSFEHLKKSLEKIFHA